MVLEKAKLHVWDSGGSDATDITLMFNPTEISFSRTSNWTSDPGHRGSTLLPKVNFAGVEPYNFTLSKLVFDAYETKESVMTKYINNIKKGVAGSQAQQTVIRPPVYIFIWREQYFPCVMTSLTYTLNLFLPDGTPVRATVDIVLQEVDLSNSPGTQLDTGGGNSQQNSNLAPTTN